MRTRKLLTAAVALALALTMPGSATFGVEEPISITVQADDPVAAGSPLIAELGRVQVQLNAHEPTGFGGLWVDSDGNPTVAAVGAIHPLLDKEVGGLSVPTQVVHVKYSEAELDALHPALLAREHHEFADGGSQLVQITTDIVENRVIATVISPTDELREWAQVTYGDAVVIVAADQTITGNACSITNCPSPLKAGLKLFRASAFVCMGGFIMRTTGPHYWWSTAGHCASGPGGWQSATDTFQHPAGTNRGSVTYQGWFENSTADVALFEISSSQKSNVLCRGVTCLLSNVTTREDGSSDVVGETINWQRQNGYSSGSLTSRNVTVQVCKPGSGGCHWIKWQRNTTATSNPGDSGGPVFAPSGTMAIGFISTQHTYSHISSLEQQASVLTQLTP